MPNRSQTKIVAIILVVFFLNELFRLTDFLSDHLTFSPQKEDKHVASTPRHIVHAVKTGHLAAKVAPPRWSSPHALCSLR